MQSRPTDPNAHPWTLLLSQVQTLTVLTTALSTADGGAAVSSGFGAVDLLRTAREPVRGPGLQFGTPAAVATR